MSQVIIYHSCWIDMCRGFDNSQVAGRSNCLKRADYPFVAAYKRQGILLAMNSCAKIY